MFKGTTNLAVRTGRELACGGDGQVTMGDTVMKHGARKVRWLFDHRFWPVLPVPPPTRLRFLSVLRRN